AGGDVPSFYVAVAVPYRDAGAVESNPDILLAPVERIVIEAGENDIVHGVPRRYAGHESAHQEPRNRRIAVGEMIDIGLVEFRIRATGRQLEAGEARIACFHEIESRNCIAPQREEIQGTALETIGDLGVAAAVFEQVIAIAGFLQESDLCGGRPPREEILVSLIEPDELLLRGRGNRELGNELADRFGVPALAGIIGNRCGRVAADQCIAAERGRSKKIPRESPSEA